MLENETNNNFDPEGFEAFFRTHPNDATIEEKPPTESEENNTENSDNNTGVENENNTEGNTEEANTGSEDNKESDNLASKPTVNTQQAQAFAQMRIANKQQQQLLNKIAEVVGVKDTKDSNAVMEALQSLVLKAQSEKQGIPQEFLERLHTLESRDQEYQRQQAYLAAGRGFQTIKDKFNVTDDGLEAFAKELIQDGLNPYEQPLNLVQEYQNRHFDELIEQAVQRGINQEAQRSAKAGTHGSTPNQSKGGTDDTSEKKINTVADLNKWLDEHK